MNENYVPMMHSYLFDSLRVPMFIEGDEYCICVGKGEYRYYTKETLPDNQDARLNETGWRVSDSVYILVLDNSTLQDMKGGGDDTRRQS